jgi:transaldolase
MDKLSALTVRIFADGADRAGMREMYRNPLIKGFTTNPTLMRKAGITDYEAFARQMVADIPDRHLSFEVFSDEFEEMEAQARRIATWGDQVYVKVPVTNTRGESSAELVQTLARAGVKLNVTAVFTLGQVAEVCQALGGRAPAVVSVFAGRIADAGLDPVPLMAAARELVSMFDGIELLWASPREVFNIFQADAVGCHIITVANDLLKKLDAVGKDLNLFSLETVKMFRRDAVQAGFTLEEETRKRKAA